MKTQINGKDADWTDEIQTKWDAVAEAEDAPEGTVVSSNYFTPRPWRNEYDRGSPDEGFTYVVNRSVWQVIINREDSQ